MANTKISALPAAGVGDIATGEFPMAHGGATKKVSGANLNTHIQNTLEATYSTLGVVQLATVQEVSDGLDIERVITPDAYRKAVPYYASRSINYILSLVDRNTDQWCNASLVCTIPLASSVNFEVGSTIPFLRITAGTVTIDATAGVILNGVNGGSCTLRTQYQGALLKKVGADTWVISGDVSAVA